MNIYKKCCVAGILLGGLLIAWRLLPNPECIALAEQDARWDSSNNLTHAQLKALTAQSFAYFGSGEQFVVFVNDEGTILLKLFKKTQDDAHLFASTHIAYTHLQEETALLALHLNPTDAPLWITLRDRWGRSQEIDLAKRPFLLQKRVPLLFDCLQTAVHNQQMEEAKIIIAAYLQHHKARCQKGIRFTDQAIKRNFGFCEGKAICFDVGSFVHREELKRQDDLVISTKRLRQWLEKHAQELLPYANGTTEK